MSDKYWVYHDNVQATIQLTGQVHIRDREGKLLSTLDLSDRPPDMVKVDGYDSLLTVGETYSVTFNLDLPVEGPGASNDE